MNLGDPELELIDPTPNIHSLFIHFDKIFFWEKLSSRTAVRWSKRMYSCAGTCSYAGKYSMCDIALSEPLLKLRPRKDLLETLLHEMIHAYLFILNKDRDRDGHGPNFQKHMHRINQLTGLNITIYHDFHDEVDLYRTHWWRCNGPCQFQKPYFGVVRRSSNRAPGPSDYWWENHKRACNGNFIKIKGPEIKRKNPSKKQTKMNNNQNIVDSFKNSANTKTVVKPAFGSVKPQNSLFSQSNIITSTPKVHIQSPYPKISVMFSGQGRQLGGQKIETITSITETVRKIWAEKEFSRNKSNILKVSSKGNKSNTCRDPNKRPKTTSVEAPVKKLKRIDDFFKTPEKTRSSDTSCLEIKSDLALCPVCNTSVYFDNINNHIDECLNTQAIIDLAKSDLDQISKSTIDFPDQLFNDTKTIGKVNSDQQNYGSDQTNAQSNLDSYYSVSSDNSMSNSSDKVSNTNVLNSLSKINDDYINLAYTNQLTQPLNEIKSCNETTETLETKFKDVCVCCNKKINISMAEHLEECLSFFSDDSTIPQEAPSVGLNSNAIILDDDDIFDETNSHNETGTKFPCPCCMKMIEGADMNHHLDTCLK